MGISITESFEIQIRGCLSLMTFVVSVLNFCHPVKYNTTSELKYAFQNHAPAFPPVYLSSYILIKQFSKSDSISLRISAPLEAVECVTDQKAAPLGSCVSGT